MAEEMTPEQIAEMQRKNCIFCKIIAGEIESKKVFEDERFLAILDIRPAAPGHILLMPKEHVPILPLLSEERMDALFTTATRLSAAVQEAMIAQRTTVFIASGYAAGQQAPHLMLHIIPREKGDGLEMLDLEREEVAQADALALGEIFSQATKQALAHRGREDLTKQHHIHKKQPAISAAVPEATPAGPALVNAKGTPGDLHTTTTPDSPGDRPSRVVQGPDVSVDERNIAPERVVEFETTNEALAAALTANPDLRRLIIAQPDLVTEYVRKSPKLTKLFEGVDIRALALMLQRQDAAAPQARAMRTAQQMTDEELFRFIDGNEGLRAWMMDNPEEFAARLPQNPRLQQFFQGVDVGIVARKYKQRGGA